MTVYAFLSDHNNNADFIRSAPHPGISRFQVAVDTNDENLCAKQGIDYAGQEPNLY